MCVCAIVAVAPVESNMTRVECPNLDDSIAVADWPSPSCIRPGTWRFRKINQHRTSCSYMYSSINDLISSYSLVPIRRGQHSHGHVD